MNGTWMTTFLGLALIAITAMGLRQTPTFSSGRLEYRNPSVHWIAGFLAIWITIQIVLGFILGIFLVIGSGGPVSPDELATRLQNNYDQLLLVSQLISLVTVLVATSVSLRIFRRQSLLDLGLSVYRGWLLDTAMGLLLGFIGFFLLFIVGSATGLVTVSRQATLEPAVIQSLITAFIIFVMVALSEEILIRGYMLQTLELGWGTIAAAVASSLFWGALHLTNPGSTLGAAITLGAAGLVFAYAYIITRSLWLPIALHFSWNLSEGPIFGFSVSGLETQGIVSSQLNGPDFITGGAFGPEAGLIVIPILVLQILILRWWLNVRPDLGIIQPDITKQQ